MLPLGQAHQFKLKVYTEDTDYGGVVYHANYLKFFERARTEYLCAHSQSLTTLKDNFELSFVIKSVKIDYLKPARLEQTLIILTRIVKFGSASLIFEQIICDENLEKSLCKANVVVVAINAEIKPIKIPTQIIQELQREC